MTAKKMRISSDLMEEVHEYLKGWINSESWCDLSVMLDRGDTEMACNHMSGTGAIDPDQCYPEFKHVEQAVLELGKRFGKLSDKARSKRYDEVFKECFIASCSDCNHVSFADCGNEKIYPELTTECWECGSHNIETRVGLRK